jgi:hypothetical protein
MQQLHKRFSEEQVKELIGRYIRGEVKREAIEEVLRISKTRFFELVKMYKEGILSIEHKRERWAKRINSYEEEGIREELKIDRCLVEDREIPVYKYNYSYIRQQLRQKYGIEVSVPTIINRARAWGYYKARKKRRDLHTREVISNYTGELIQHDSSYHLFAPMCNKKWYLITSIDDYSRYMIEARFIERESTVEHIKSLERVFTKYGIPLSYYTDSHSIFRFVAGRDDVLKSVYLKTEQAQTQWEEVLLDCGVKRIYALSPQAKGKIERPYQWIQDHLVRRCVREGIVDIKEGQEILNEEVKAYNRMRVHSTTQEVPYERYSKAKLERSLWRDFEVPQPYKSVRDIFSVRRTRRADGYRSISFNNTKIRVNGLNPYEEVEIRIYKLNEQMSELRFWRGRQLLDVQRLKNKDINMQI